MILALLITSTLFTVYNLDVSFLSFNLYLYLILCFDLFDLSFVNISLNFSVIDFL